MSFGQQLEQIRKSRHVSQAQLGAVLGVTQQMISSYEKNLSSPSVDALVQIATYFNISLDTLVGYQCKAPEATSPEARFLHYFHSLSAANQEKCITIAQTLLEASRL